MIHLWDCPEWSSREGDDNRCGDCDHCRTKFESARSYCGKCWNIVSNKAYFAKNSKHILGTCNQRHVIPDSIYRRTADANCGHGSQWWTDYRRRQAAERASEEESEVERRIRLLEEQNRLLRQLAAA